MNLLNQTNFCCPKGFRVFSVVAIIFITGVCGFIAFSLLRSEQYIVFIFWVLITLYLDMRFIGCFFRRYTLTENTIYLTSIFFFWRKQAVLDWADISEIQVRTLYDVYQGRLTEKLDEGYLYICLFVKGRSSPEEYQNLRAPYGDYDKRVTFMIQQNKMVCLPFSEPLMRLIGDKTGLLHVK